MRLLPEDFLGWVFDFLMVVGGQPWVQCAVRSKMCQVRILIPFSVIVRNCRIAYLPCSSYGQVQFKEVIYSEHNPDNHLVVAATIRQATVFECRLRDITSIFTMTVSITCVVWEIKITASGRDSQKSRWLGITVFGDMTPASVVCSYLWEAYPLHRSTAHVK